MRRERFQPYYTPEEVWDLDGGVTCGSDDELRDAVAHALSKVPRRIVDNVMRSVQFHMARPETKGAFIPTTGLKAVIVICDPSEDTILHEIAHFVLRHRPGWELKSDKEYERQEQEAWALVAKW